MLFKLLTKTLLFLNIINPSMANATKELTEPLDEKGIDELYSKLVSSLCLDRSKSPFCYGTFRPTLFYSSYGMDIKEEDLYSGRKAELVELGSRPGNDLKISFANGLKNKMLEECIQVRKNKKLASIGCEDQDLCMPCIPDTTEETRFCASIADKHYIDMKQSIFQNRSGVSETARKDLVLV